MASSDDAHERVTALSEYAAHYRGNVAKGEGMSVVTHAEMAVILDELVSLFKSTGVGVRKSVLGQAMPEKKSWERHG